MDILGVKEGLEDTRLDKEILVEDDGEIKNNLFIDRKNRKPINIFSNKIDDIVKMNMEDINNINELLNKKIITKKILIDSRDIGDSGQSNNFTIHLNNDFKNIVSLKLLNALIPNSDYIINSSNNLLHFRESNNVLLTATIPEGNYTVSELISEIETQLESAGNSDYTVSYDTYKRINEDLTGASALATSSEGDAWKVFDTDNDTFWNASTNTGYVIYDFQTKKVVDRYTMIFYESGIGYPTDWTIDISDDKVNWTTIDTQSSQVLTQYQTKQYDINNSLGKRYVRINITDSSNSTDLQLSLLNYFSTSDGEYISIVSDLTGGDNIFELVFEGESKKYNDVYLTSYKNNSIGQILGFDNLDLTNGKEYVANNKINFENNNYLFLEIKEKENTIHTSDTNDIFSKIPLNCDINDYMNYKSNDTPLEFNAPIDLSKLQIMFKHKNGTFYDFRGYPHSLLFEVEILH